MSVWKGVVKTLTTLIQQQKKDEEIESAPDSSTIYKQLMAARSGDKRDIVIDLIGTKGMGKV